MTVPGSRRERKKLETRRKIADAAIGLFLRHGYDQTTVAQIAAAADVDPKTFFNYFGSKDEVVFATGGYDDFLAGVKDRRPGESPGEALTRLVEGYDEQVVPTRLRDPAEQAALSELILTTPALQAKLQTLLNDLQRRLAEALLSEFPDDLDEVTAAAMTGSLIGALYQAGLMSIQLGHTREQARDTIRRARDIALYGLLNTTNREAER
jgi:AcrR family transcriptional regulator